MKDSAHLHDTSANDFPKLLDNGLSDLYMVFTTDGLILMAQYGKDGYWHGEADETFGNVTHWYDGYPIPHNFKISYERFAGEP